MPVGLLSVGAKIKDICTLMVSDCSAADFQKKKEEDYFIYGTPVDKIEKMIKSFKPDIVGISVLSATQLASAVSVSDISRRINPGTKIVFGGPDPSVRYEYLLDNNYCDFCVVGEGEETFYEFVKRVNEKLSLEGISGLAYRTNGKINYSPRGFINRLDDMPLPAYELVNPGDYFNNRYFYNMRSSLKKDSMPVITSRGCPYGCIFCSVHLHMGRKYRAHTPEYVINNLKYCINNFRIRRFHFEDDNISLNRERFESILDKIIGEGLKIEWDAPNGIRADTLDFNLLKKMKAAGCKGLSIGIESGNQDVLNRIIKKDTSIAAITKVAEYCRELRIKLLGFYIIGFPGETKKNIEETINLALSLLSRFDVNPALLFAVPLYGTELYDICVKKGLIPGKLSEYDLSTASQPYGNPMITTEDFTEGYLKKTVFSYNLRLVIQLIKYHIRLLKHGFEERFFKIRLDRILSPRLVYAFLSPFKKPQTIIEFYGNKLLLNFNDRLYFNIFKDREALPLKLIMNEVTSGGRVIDIGAHIGCYTLLLAKLIGPEGRLYAFEPNPESFDMLKKNIELNSYKNVTAIQKAAFDRMAEARLYLNGPGVTHSLRRGNNSRRHITVDAVSLDEYLKDETAGFDFIKIDAEGAEYNALLGMKNIIIKSSPLKIMVKYAPLALKKFNVLPEEFLRLLSGLGFALYDINEKTNSVEHTDIPKLLKGYKIKRSHYTNLFCVK